MQKSISFLRTFATRSPLATFLALGVGIAWLFWLAAWPAAGSDPTAFRHLVALGAFGPSAAAFLLGLLQPERRERFRWDLFVMALLATGLLYFLCLPYASTLPAGDASWGWAYRLGLWALPAFLIASAFSGSQDLRALLLPLRFQPRDAAWYAAALLVMPALMGAGYAIALALGETASVQISSNPAEVAISIAAVFIYILLFGGALGEESGLRGWLLPRLQARWSPLVASLLLGVGWAVWRMPLYLNGYYPLDASGLLLRVLFNLLISLPLTWFYNRTRANLLACILLHATATSASFFLPVSQPALILLAVLSLALVLEARMWKRAER